MTGKRHPGFTLIETLVSFGILLVALLVTTGVFARVRAGCRQSEARADAATLGGTLLAEEHRERTPCPYRVR